MNPQPQQKPESGCLYLIGTPIGNLEDISMRALRTLREADLLAAEDTRRLQHLLARYEIRKPVVSYHKFSEKRTAPMLLEKIRAGQAVGLVSDAGMPCISDPGREIVSLCVAQGLPVVPIPGPCSIETALCASGLDTRQFVFLGFAPKKKSHRRKLLAPFVGDFRALVLFESPYRIQSMLLAAFETLGNRRAAIGRELTKHFEEFVRGDLATLSALTRKWKGEIVLVIEGDDGSAPPPEDEPDEGDGREPEQEPDTEADEQAP